MRAAYFLDDSAPRRPQDREQLAAMLAAAAEELDTTGPDGLQTVEAAALQLVTEGPR